ncbi:MAG: hypothetical protein GX791_07965 [Synergistaceae bacterium]|nr:hypothetical protein [Synergistaceae bacterium]
MGMSFLSWFEEVRTGSLWGIGTPTWLWTAVGCAALHQIYVWFCWRTELHAHLLTRLMGSRAFPVYAFGFALIGALRVAAALLLAISNRNTIPGSIIMLRAFALLLFLPSLYLFYSVARYFTFRRALGIDHFDESCRFAPFVRKGIFRFTPNGMYIYGFLLLWAVALWYASLAALGAALFNHIYIFVHYYSTELPDMKRIYGKSP